MRTPSFGACLLASLIFGWVGDAQALGLGAPQAYSSLGQPLLLSFPLSLRAGESLSLDCVFAEVTAGTTKLAPSKVSVRLEGESESALRAIRVLSSVPIEEPILHVSLSLGCPVRLTRQFSALMDPPPGHDAPAPDAAAAVAVASPRALSAALRAALATADAKPKALMGANPSEALGQQRLTAAKPGGAQETVTSPDRIPGSTASKSKPSSSGGAKLKKAAAPSVPTASLSSSEPQLRLEAFEPNSPAADSAASAASAAEAAMARLLSVESGLLGLQADYRSNAAKLNALRQEVAAESVQAPSGDAMALAWVMGGLALLLGGMVVYLWRGRPRQQRGPDTHWWGQESVQESTYDSPAAEPAMAPSQPVGEAQLSKAAKHDDDGRPSEGSLGLLRFAGADEPTMALAHSAEPEYASQESAVAVEPPDAELSGLARISHLMDGDLSLEPLSVQFIDPSSDGHAVSPVASSSPSPAGQDLVSVEKLIDLEQQVDFFLVLGQDEAALDLLHAQLNSAGAQLNSAGAQGKGSALAYLKLMEICQQRGDALAFADIAGRYAVQFDAVPPAWEAELELGRGLEAYGDVMIGLQAHWADSGASMSALQKLLSAADGRSVRFELPALRDLLLLYSVARDRSEHEVRGEEIDLFLPLESGAHADEPAGFDLMATIVWQGQPGTAATPVEVDILLDGLNPNPNPNPNPRPGLGV
ncbi:hypothetical protein [Roseateles sp.]|uniref:type IV pilus assembly protein FimV n=1 Tax=Roseateles sp. TaxID=1971397 RepID=UPI00286CBDAB|nr:hypothetical protein [Roseateles sp.]